MSKDINIEILRSLHKGAKMGMDSISFISEKVTDDEFKDNLSFQYTEYSKIVDDANKLFENYGQIPDENTAMNTFMSWTGTQMNTLTDKSTSHLSEMLIQGNTMGIIEGRKLMNHESPNLNPDINNLLNTFVTMQENNVEKLKQFL